MLPPFQKKLTNWVDGMKISKDHFQALENYFLEAQRDIVASQLTDYNYGLLFESNDQVRSESACQVIVDAEKVEVHRCRAITPGGARIEILEGSHPHLRKPMSELLDIYSSPAQQLYVILSVDPLKRIPSGDPSVEESPFRYPQALPSYRLEVVPAEQMSSTQLAAYSLPIAKILKFPTGYEADKRYIPPCTRLRSVSDLANFFEHQGNLIKELADNSLMEIMKKVREKRRKKENNDLSDDIGDLAFSIIQYCIDHIDEYRLLLKEQAPVYSVLWFVKLARNISNQYQHARNKDNLLQYLNNYAGTMGGQIETYSEGVFNLKYNHADIRNALDTIYSMTEFWINLFNRLRGLSFVDFAKQSMIQNVVHHHGNTTITPTTKSEPKNKIVITNKENPPEQSNPSGSGSGWNLDD